jgi:hypothetical protein
MSATSQGLSNLVKARGLPNLVKARGLKEKVERLKLERDAYLEKAANITLSSNRGLTKRLSHQRLD